MDTSKENTYLIFKLNNELYAVPVALVTEAIDAMPATKVPRSPEYMRGVVNLRGEIIPVINIRMLLNMPFKEDDIFTSFVILDMMHGDHRLMASIVADGMSEVIEIEKEQILSVPEIGCNYDTDLLVGMVLFQNQFVFILNLPQLFTMILGEKDGSKRIA